MNKQGKWAAKEPVAQSPVAGNYADSHYVAHGFVRSVKGQITEFDVTGLQGTE